MTPHMGPSPLCLCLRLIDCWSQFRPSRIGCVSLGVFWGFGSLYWSGLKSGQVSTGHGWFFALIEDAFFFLFLGAACSLQTCVLPRPSKIQRFLRPALGARLFSAGSLRPCAVVFGGFRVRSAEGFFFLCLLVFVFVCLVFGAATFF